MGHPFRELRDKMSPEAQERVKARTEAMLATEKPEDFLRCCYTRFCGEGVVLYCCPHESQEEFEGYCEGHYKDKLQVQIRHTNPMIH